MKEMLIKPTIMCVFKLEIKCQEIVLVVHINLVSTKCRSMNITDMHKTLLEFGQGADCNTLIILITKSWPCYRTGPYCRFDVMIFSGRFP